MKGCCVNVAMVCLSDFNGCLRLFWMNWRYCVSNGAVVVVWVDYGMLFFGMVNWLLCWLWFGCLGMGKYGCGRSRCWTLNFDVLVFVGGPIGSRLPVTCLSCSAMELLCTFCTLCTVQSVQPIYLVFAYRLHSSIQYCFGTLFVSAFDFFNFSIYQHFIEISSLYS